MFWPIEVLDSVPQVTYFYFSLFSVFYQVMFLLPHCMIGWIYWGEMEGKEVWFRTPCIEGSCCRGKSLSFLSVFSIYYYNWSNADIINAYDDIDVVTHMVFQSSPLLSQETLRI